MIFLRSEFFYGKHGLDTGSLVLFISDSTHRKIRPLSVYGARLEQKKSVFSLFNNSSLPILRITFIFTIKNVDKEC